MKKQILLLLIITFTATITYYADAQCTWQTIQSDGFEYTTSIPDLMPGVCVHSTPQTFAAHSGTYGMYMNFINCNGGVGTCAGTKVYERIYNVCPGMPIRLKGWMTTTFAGSNYIQCDMKLVIRDANGVLLDSVPGLLCPFLTTGGWIQYTSGTVYPSTSSITFTMFTNADGGNGNDLTVDDLSLEGCIRTGSTQVVPVCSNISTFNIYDYLPSNSVNTGSWAGPSSLSGGYLGTFVQGTNNTGNYYYSSNPYGTTSGCPSRTDTVLALSSTAPAPNLFSDTTICFNQNLLLNPGTSAVYSHLWSTGASSATITVSNSNSAISSITYLVTVTNQAGCSATDSVKVSFVTCSGLNEQDSEMGFQLYPNPAQNEIRIKSDLSFSGKMTLAITDISGRTMMIRKIEDNSSPVLLPDLAKGLYHAVLMMDGRAIGKSQLIIQ